MVETDDVPGVSSQRPTEPVAIIDAPNAASSRLICRACRRAELVADSGVTVAWLSPAGIEMMGVAVEALGAGVGVEDAGTTSFVGSLWSDPEVPVGVCESPVPSVVGSSELASPPALPACFSVVCCS